MAEKKKKKREKKKVEKGSLRKDVFPQRASEADSQEKVLAPNIKKLELWLSRISYLGIIVLAFMMSYHTLVDTDIFWQLKAGEIIFESHQVPKQDLFSFTKAGEEWIDSQWLFQLVIYLAYLVGHYWGMVFFGALLMAITWVLILLPNYSSEKYFRIILLSLVCLLAVSSRLRLRPEFFTFFFLALELFLLHLYQRGKRWAIYPIPVIVLLWVNSHGLWPMALFILGAYLAEQVLALPGFGLQKYFKLDSAPGKKQAILELGICLLVSGVMVFLNPYGWRGIVFPLRLLWEISSEESFIGRYIGEFGSPFLLNNPVVRPAYIALVIFGGLLFLLLLFFRRLPIADLIICAGFFYISINANRNVPLFAIVMAVLGGKQVLNFPLPSWLSIKQYFSKFFWVRILGTGFLLITMLWLGKEVITERFFLWDRLFCKFGSGALETDYPIRAVEFLKSIPELNEDLKIFCDIHNSGYLIWAGYPRWKVYVDPRMEVYGDEFIKRYSLVLSNLKEFEVEDARYDFDLVFVSAYRMDNGSELVRYFARNPSWFLFYLDGKNIVFLKNRPRFSRVIQNYQINLAERLNTPLPRNQGDFGLVKERLNRGLLLLWLNYKESALYEFEEAHKLDPKEPNVIYNLGLTLNALKRYSEALPYLEENARNYPDDTIGHIQLAWALAFTGKPGRAISILQGVLNASPNELDACIKLSKIFEMIKDFDEAYKQWQRCEQIARQGSATARQSLEISEALKRLGAGDAGVK